MHPLFNTPLAKGLRPHLLTLGIMAITLKALATIGLFFLPAVTVETHVQESKAKQYFSINAQKVFGSSAPKAATTSPAATPAGASATENLTPLKALQIYAIYHSDSMRFITLKDGADVAFLEEGESFKGYLLEKIHPIKAIFSRGGERYELSLKDDDLDKKVAEATKEQAPVQAAAVQTMNNIPRDEIKAYQKDMTRIWSNIGIKENKSGGKMDGFVITFVKQGSVFEQLGLQKGDVLKEANGIKLNSYKDALALYKQIDNIKVFKLVILRDNQEKELEYEIF